MGTNFNYDDVSHQVIFDRINGGSGSDSLQEASRAWQRLSEEIGLTGKSYVQNAIRGILTARDGAAAEAAAAATAAMLPWMDDIALIAATAAQRTQGQADFWVTAKNSIPPVPAVPQSAGSFGDPGEWFAEKVDWIPGVTSEEEQAQQRLQDAAEQARRAMRVYQASSNANIDPALAFTPPQSSDSSIAALPLSDPHGAHLRAHQQPGGQAQSGQAMGAMAAGAMAAGAAGFATTSQLAEGGPAGPGSVAPAPSQWAGNPTPGHSVTHAPGHGVTHGVLPVNTGFGPGTVRRDTTTHARDAAAGAHFAAGGAGRAGFGARPSGEFGPRPAVGVSASLAEEMSGTRGGAGPISVARGGAGGVGYAAPFAAGAGLRGEQDNEHRSRYLVHGDSNAIVGDLPPTAPPVIGEDY